LTGQGLAKLKRGFGVIGRNLIRWIEIHPDLTANPWR
jgi:hypothetical protein